MAARPRPWEEPAHESVVRLHDDLVRIYREIRKDQEKIDPAFDRASAQIGFVVTTTIPYRVEIGERDHKIRQFSIGSEYLRGTVFERELGPALEGLVGRPVSVSSGGSFDLYLVWYRALKLKLKADWVEPAHFRREWIGAPGEAPIQKTASREERAVPSEVHEPAHWLDPSMTMGTHDKLVITALDEVYPELQLVSRLAQLRRPDVKLLRMVMVQALRELGYRRDPSPEPF